MDSSKAPVVVIVAIILMGAIIWGVWAVRMAGEIDPERAKTLASEAERECVLQGFDPKTCPQMVGKHHRDCLEKTDEKSKKPLLDESVYLECMTEAFGQPKADGPPATDTGTPASADGGGERSADTAGDSRETSEDGSE